MKDQQIIDWKIASLANGDNSELSEELQSYLRQHSELQDELSFIEQFWTTDSKPEVMPSDKLDANFYQMLSRAQASQTETTRSEAVPQQDSQTPLDEQPVSLIETVKSWFTPMPVAQFATLALVFTLGMNLNPGFNNEGNTETSNEAYAGLQQEVSSLTAVLAMSMLQQDSASERLSGVAYSLRTDLSNPLLIEQLMDTLARDKSTSVRLAIIKSLAQLSSFSAIEQRLFTIATQEKSLLVQIELCRLLLNYGSEEVKNLLAEPANQQHLAPEVIEFILAQSTASYI